MKPDTSSVSVVLVGQFAPADFSLETLSSVKAVRASDLESAKYESLIKDQVVDIRFSWGKLVVLRDKLLVEANEAPYIRAADFVLKIVKELSPSASVRQLGINYIAHFVMPDGKQRDELGQRLLPPMNWGTWGKQVAKSFELPAEDPQHGGMMLAVIRQGKPDDRPAGYIDARVEPALRGTQMGVLVSINDHFEMARANDAKAQSERIVTATMLDLLERGFDVSVQRSMDITTSIMVES